MSKQQSDTPISDATPHNVAELGMLCRKLERKLAAANERVKELEHALSFVIPNCQWLHHEKCHRHAAGDHCPVEAIINKAQDRV